MSSFHSPLAGNESCCLWCEGEPGGGNNGAERKCQPQCTGIRAHCCVFSMCVCMCICVCMCVCVCVYVCLCVYPFSRVIKDPILRTHTHAHTQPLWTPAEELSSAAALKEPCSPVLPLHLFPLLSSISPCRVISLPLFLSLSAPLSLSLCMSTFISVLLSFSTSLSCFKSGDYQKSPRLHLAREKRARFQGWAEWILNSPLLCPLVLSLFDSPTAGEHSCSDSDCC